MKKTFQEWRGCYFCLCNIEFVFSTMHVGLLYCKNIFTNFFGIYQLEKYQCEYLAHVIDSFTPPQDAGTLIYDEWVFCQSGHSYRDDLRTS